MTINYKVCDDKNEQEDIGVQEGPPNAIWGQRKGWELEGKKCYSQQSLIRMCRIIDVKAQIAFFMD